jgi:hypothetical protein
MPMYENSIARVVLFTADACLTADLDTNGERVKDILNHPHGTLELTRISYANPERPGVSLAEYGAGALRKSEIGCVVVLDEPPLTTMRKIGVYVQKKPIRVSLLVPGMVVIGTLHIQGRYDPTMLLADSAESFIPLTEAGVVRARTTTPTAVPPERLTVFVNRAHLTGVLLADASDAAPELLPQRQEAVRPAVNPEPRGTVGTGTGRLSRFAAPEPEW